MAPNRNSKKPSRVTLRTVGSASLLVILLLLTWNTARFGLASLLTAYAASTGQIASANTAVRLNASNPDAHYARATILEASDLPAAIAEHQQAALARPDDYVLWLSLARARELNGDQTAAIVAARQAVPLAPDYAEPHYQLGNILLRAGQREEAFKELRLAGASNPTLLPGIIDLAWRVSGGDAQFVIRVIAPQSPLAYQALAEYFRLRKEVGAAIAMFAMAGSAAEPDRRSYVGELIGAKRFKEAATMWAVGRKEGAAPGVIIDPGFEQESNLDEPGFGWHLGEKHEGFRLSLDTNSPREGRSSLKVEFSGNSDPSSAVISQLVLIEPGHYQLRFALRSEAIVTGGQPLLAVTDADSPKLLGQSEPFPNATGGWREYTIAFDSGSSTGAVQITLQRHPCDKSPCPIFGRLWLDGFSLQKL